MKIKNEETKELEIKSTIRLDAYRVIDDAIDRAVRFGYQRSRKHTENPSEHQIISEIHRAIMNELCELLKFEE